MRSVHVHVKECQPPNPQGWAGARPPSGDGVTVGSPFCCSALIPSILNDSVRIMPPACQFAFIWKAFLAPEITWTKKFVPIFWRRLPFVRIHKALHCWAVLFRQLHNQFRLVIFWADVFEAFGLTLMSNHCLLVYRYSCSRSCSTKTHTIHLMDVLLPANSHAETTTGCFLIQLLPHSFS